MSNGNAFDAGLNTLEEMRCSLREILDKIGVEISDCFSQLQELESRMVFLCNSEPLVNQLHLQNHEQFTELQNECTHVAHKYSKDLNGLELYQDYKNVITSPKRAEENGKKMDFFPALKILVTAPNSVASYEHSFSKMKLIKSYMHSTMSQERSTSLATVSVKNEVVSFINFSDLIKYFVVMKSRKVQFQVFDQCHI
jgi:hypothetical protein